MHDITFVSGDGVSASNSVGQARRGGAADWYLEDIHLDGRAYLVDRHTLRVYTPAAGTGGWPHLAGRLQAGNLVGRCRLTLSNPR